MKVLEVQGLDGTGYRVMSDAYGYTCTEQAFDEDGNETFEKDGSLRYRTMKCAHFGTLRGACKRLLEEGLRLEDTTSIDALIARMDAWVARIEVAISKVQQGRA